MKGTEWIGRPTARVRRGDVMATRSKASKSKATAKKSVRKVRKTTKRSMAKPYNWESMRGGVVI
jgi:hypothetical protein